MCVYIVSDKCVFIEQQVYSIDVSIILVRYFLPSFWQLQNSGFEKVLVFCGEKLIQVDTKDFSLSKKLEESETSESPTAQGLVNKEDVVTRVIIAATISDESPTTYGI